VENGVKLLMRYQRFRYRRTRLTSLTQVNQALEDCVKVPNLGAYSTDRERGFHMIVNTDVERLTGHRCFTLGAHDGSR
jgi:hypothetical protein